MRSVAPIRRVGLARALSKLGYCSRSRASELIRAGRVTLNGKISRNPEAPVSLDEDSICVDSYPLPDPGKVYWMLNKPRGVVTTAADEKNRRTVYSCLPDGLPWMGPVGRLDKASEGLLLLTNDSVWSARLLAPQTHLDKTYHVQVAGLIGASVIESLTRGMLMPEGARLSAKKVRLLRQGDRNSWLEIVLDEGKNRQIRRMLEQLGIGVLRLVRVAIGSLTLGDLAKGAARPLTAPEKSALDRAMKGNVAR
ncbi:MAG TPA: pseudouridine synthase [Terriglobales bacterium]|nr:pseudouridine synthase [Terriglobales bacterium]